MVNEDRTVNEDGSVNKDRTSQPGTLLVRETYLNATEGYIFGYDEEPQEAWTNSVGELFLAGQREFGRCISKMYRDGDDGPKQVGWVFSKRMAYEDDRDSFYEREVWVEVFTTWEKTVVINAEHPFGQ